ncbi:MAG TPA: hypothetical protein VJ891_05655 [Casimicrobiaceae bacterium]|nr:hypothetical protein [Casimicrobiaceae bacterium]
MIAVTDRLAHDDADEIMQWRVHRRRALAAAPGQSGDDQRVDAEGAQPSVATRPPSILHGRRNRTIADCCAIGAMMSGIRANRGARRAIEARLLAQSRAKLRRLPETSR